MSWGRGASGLGRAGPGYAAGPTTPTGTAVAPLPVGKAAGPDYHSYFAVLMQGSRSAGVAAGPPTLRAGYRLPGLLRGRGY